MARLGWVRLGWVNLGSVWLGKVRLDFFRLLLFAFCKMIYHNRVAKSKCCQIVLLSNFYLINHSDEVGVLPFLNTEEEPVAVSIEALQGVDLGPCGGLLTLLEPDHDVTADHLGIGRLENEPWRAVAQPGLDEPAEQQDEAKYAGVGH